MTEAIEGTRTFTNKPVVMNAKDLVKKIVAYYWDKGMPFWQFKDTVNNSHAHPEEGIIRSSNLCMEIQQSTDEHRTVVCNLASVNLSKVFKIEDIHRVVPIVMRMLDNVADVSSYPSEKSRRTHHHTRAVGLGIMGEAQLIAEKFIMYGSQAHKDYIAVLYRDLYETANLASEDLAQEKGPWKEGKTKRNAYIGAIAPTSSIAIIAGTLASHEPAFAVKWTEENMLGVSTVTAPNINADTYPYYVSAYDVDQKDMIDLTAIRQESVDQSISHNIYFKPENTKGKDVYDLIMYAWRKKVKTLYYLRSKSKKIVAQSDTITCSGCE
jgi:ribonucleoside-diphosphate reductase alpha chain